MGGLSTGRGGFSVHQPTRSRGPWLAALLVVAVLVTGIIAAGASANQRQQGVCSTINKFHLDKQMNYRAAEILAACGRAPEGRAPSFSAVGRLRPEPHVLGGIDKNLITGGEGIYPNVTQSETQSWTNGNTIVAAYNDSRDRNANPICIAGGSYSSDGGVNWTNNHPFCPGHQANYGDPGVVYDRAHAKWIVVLSASVSGRGSVVTLTLIVFNSAIFASRSFARQPT